MLQRFFVSLLLLTFSFSWAQELEEAMPIPSTVSTVTIDQKQKSKEVDSLAVKKESPVKRKKFIEQMVEEEVIDTATIEMYQIFQQGKRTVFVDTTLTVQKEYKTKIILNFCLLLTWGLPSIDWDMISRKVHCSLKWGLDQSIFPFTRLKMLSIIECPHL
jgi:hypothetical protein